MNSPFSQWPSLTGGETRHLNRQYPEPKFPEVRIRCLQAFMLAGKRVPSYEEACKPDNAGGYMPRDAVVSVPKPVADDLVARGRAEILT